MQILFDLFLIFLLPNYLYTLIFTAYLEIPLKSYGGGLFRSGGFGAACVQQFALFHYQHFINI